MKPAIAFSVLLALAIGALPAQECPDVGTVTVPERLLAGPSTPCGIGLEITIGGVTYTSQQGFCPSFVIIMPRHAGPATKREGYRYVLGNARDVLMQTYDCYGFIWTSCQVSAPSKVINQVDNYVDVPCREPAPVSESTAAVAEL